MATYIQGQTDYISQIQPTEPNLAFDAQILQQKQAKYDANHKKVSDLYGSLLNSSLTRSDNIAARDEFFQIINDDVRRMGGLDFSLDQNVQAAAGVFQSIYTNNNIVKDMVWTRNYNSEVDRGESFKNCLDPAKCGGQWWEEGEKYLQYKRAEFKNASAGDAMNMSDPEFVPYTNVMEKAMKIAKDAGLSVSLDSFSPDGQYIITTKNGVQLKSPLTQLFGETIGKDPSIQKMYQVKSYTSRKDWIYNKVNTGEYSTEDDAAVGYFKERNDAVQKSLNKQLNDLNIDSGSLQDTFNALNTKYEAGKIKKGSDDYNLLVSLPQLMQNAEEAKSYTEMMIKATENANNTKGLRVLGDYADQQSAADFYSADIDKAALTLAYKDAEVKFEADKFALNSQEFSNAVALEGIKSANELKLETWKLDNGIYNDKIGGGSSGAKPSDIADYRTKQQEVETFENNLKSEALKYFQKDYDTTATLLTFTRSPTEKDAQIAYDKSFKRAYDKLKNLKIEANAKALKIGEFPKYTDVISATDLKDNSITQEQGTKFTEDMIEYATNIGIATPDAVVKAFIAGKRGNDKESIYSQLTDLKP